MGTPQSRSNKENDHHQQHQQQHQHQQRDDVERMDEEEEGDKEAQDTAWRGLGGGAGGGGGGDDSIKATTSTTRTTMAATATATTTCGTWTGQPAVHDVVVMMMMMPQLPIVGAPAATQRFHQSGDETSATSSAASAAAAATTTTIGRMCYDYDHYHPGTVSYRNAIHHAVASCFLAVTTTTTTTNPTTAAAAASAAAASVVTAGAWHATTTTTAKITQNNMIPVPQQGLEGKGGDGGGNSVVVHQHDNNYKQDHDTKSDTEENTAATTTTTAWYTSCASRLVDMIQRDQGGRFLVPINTVAAVAAAVVAQNGGAGNCGGGGITGDDVTTSNEQRDDSRLTGSAAETTQTTTTLQHEPWQPQPTDTVTVAAAPPAAAATREVGGTISSRPELLGYGSDWITPFYRSDQDVVGGGRSELYSVVPQPPQHHHYQPPPPPPPQEWTVLSRKEAILHVLQDLQSAHQAASGITPGRPTLVPAASRQQESLPAGQAAILDVLGAAPTVTRKLNPNDSLPEGDMQDKENSDGGLATTNTITTTSSSSSSNSRVHPYAIQLIQALYEGHQDAEQQRQRQKQQPRHVAAPEEDDDDHDQYDAYRNAQDKETNMEVLRRGLPNHVESIREKRIRDLLRQRYVSAVVVGGWSIPKFLVRILIQWGIDDQARERLLHSHSSPRPSSQAATMTIMTPSAPPAAMASTFKVQNNKRRRRFGATRQIKQKIEPEQMNEGAASSAAADADAAQLGQRAGAWSLEERESMLQGLELYGYGAWKDITEMIPTRTIKQVRDFGYNMQRKHRYLKSGDRPNEALRVFLLPDR